MKPKPKAKNPPTQAQIDTQVCPGCKGTGSRNCIMGCLTCGMCGGSGKIDPSQDQSFEAQVLRNLSMKARQS